MSNNQIDFSLNVDTKNSEAELNKLSSALNNIPVVGNKASASLQRISKGISSITKLNPALLSVSAGIAGIGAAALLSYKNSEKLRNEIDKLKTTTLAPVNRAFQGLGDAIASVVRQINEANERIEILNGHGLDSVKNSIAGVRDEFAQMQESLKASITLFENLGGEDGELKLLGVSANQYKLREEESKKNIEIYQEELKKQKELKLKYERELSIQIAKIKKINVVDENTAIEQAAAQHKLNDLKKVFEKTEENIKTIEEQIQVEIKAGTHAIEQQNKIQEEIQKKTTKTTTKIKEQKDILTELREKLAQIKQYAQYQNDLNNEDLDDEKERKQYLERKLSSLNQQKSVIEQIYNEERKRGIENEETKKTYEAIKKEIEAITDELNDTGKAQITWQQWANEGIQAFSQLNSLGQGIASLTLKLIDTSIYDKAIADAQAKITAFNEWKVEQEEAEAEKGDAKYEAYLERLDKEYEIAKEVGDKMTMLAIENKKKELAKEQEKLEKEKEITAKEKELEKELAIAEYNKSYAEWQNECAIAEQNKQMNLAQAFIQPLQAAANAALGIAQSFAQFGLPGVALGTAASIGVIASAVSSASAYKSSAQQLDSVKNSPPTPPAFQFGTQGYQLEHGQSAIVGETGAEVIRNMAGKLVVESNAQAKAMGRFNDGSMHIQNVIFNVSSIVDKSTIYKAMNEYKERDSFRYTR